MEKHKKFMTIREAIRDIIDALVRPDCVEEIAEIFSFLEGGSSQNDQRDSSACGKQSSRYHLQAEKIG
jgi:hypothetical protein